MRDRVEKFLKDRVDSSWLELLTNALLELDRDYLEFILNSKEYIPNSNNIFNAFKSLPKSKVKYILFGQDPYPREESAIGYAFIDGAVKSIFSKDGLSKEVNRATSLRNFIKMLLVNINRLNPHNTTKEALKDIKKDDLIDSIYDLKSNFEKSGVLLLNVALLFTSKDKSNYHIKQWRPFIKYLLNNLNPKIELILFGNHAKDIVDKLQPPQKYILIEHPYNVSFINSKEAYRVFGKMNLLFPH